MGKKLYRIHVEKSFDILVAAKDEQEAEDLALLNAEEESQNIDRNWDLGEVHLVTSIDQVPREWKGSIPWGSDDDSTVVDLLAREPE